MVTDYVSILRCRRPLMMASAGVGLLAMALVAGPAAAQDSFGQIMTPFSTSAMPAPFATPGQRGIDGRPHDGHHGHHDDFHHHFPFFVFPFAGGFVDDGGTGSVQSNPVNTAPFAPAAPPTANDRTPTAPYRPPSVEMAPGGIEIIRGPG